jgi:nicotinate-nucleotide adenylyltransferase
MTIAVRRQPSGVHRAKPPPAFPGMTIGLMGGSFNPVHEGHVLVARTALRRLGLDRLWWLVTPGNPLKFKSGLEGLTQRAAAARVLAPRPRVVVTTFEAELGSSYTADVVAFLRRRHPGVRFVWVMGADNLASFHHWQRWRDIARLVPIAVVDRPGWRLKAVASPAARVLAGQRVPEARAQLMTRTPLPAWALLTARLSPQSSTALRAARRGAELQRI